MLIDLLDRVTGRVTKKWLIGRRMVLDLSEANESRIAVIELPAGTFSFDIRDLEGKSELVLMSDAGPHVVATYSNRALAIQASKRIKFAMTRPLKRAVWACIGILIVMFTLDVMFTPRAARVGGVRPGSGAAQVPGGLTQEQMGALLRQRMAPPSAAAAKAGESAPAPSAGLGDVLTGPGASAPEQQSSPEAQAALRLLKGK